MFDENFCVPLIFRDAFEQLEGLGKVTAPAKRKGFARPLRSAALSRRPGGGRKQHGRIKERKVGGVTRSNADQQSRGGSGHSFRRLATSNDEPAPVILGDDAPLEHVEKHPILLHAQQEFSPLY